MAASGSPRARRLAETARRHLTDWLHQQPPDRHLGFVTITDVRATGDLGQLTVYVTVYDTPVPGAPGDGSATREDTMATLTALTPVARTWIARRVRLRQAPTLRFVLDDLPDQSARIEELLAAVRTQDSQATPTSGDPISGVPIPGASTSGAPTPAPVDPAPVERSSE